MAQELGKMLELKSMPFGATPQGKEWCLKCLHPSDPLVEIQGIPDENADISVAQNFQMAVKISAPATATASWSLQLAFHAHPVIFGVYAITDDHAATTYGIILNSSLSGATRALKTYSFCQSVSEYRCMYAGLTGFLDATAVTDSGSVGAAQYILEPVKGLMYRDVAGVSATVQSKKKKEDEEDTSVTYAQLFQPKALAYVDTWRGYDALQTMPNAYMGKAKEGFYVPLRISDSLTEYKSTRDLVQYLSYTECAAASDPVTLASICAGVKREGLTVTGAATGQVFPFGSGLDYTAGWYDAILKPSERNLAEVQMTNLHPDAGISLMFRLGFETKVYPGTSLSQFAKLSPVHDPVAIDAYQKISRELKDAYPERFNLLGLLWNGIKEIGKRVLPVLKRAATGAIAGVMNKPLAPPTTVKTSDRDRPSAAEVERVQRVLEAPPAPPMGRSYAVQGPLRRGGQFVKNRGKSLKKRVRRRKKQMVQGLGSRYQDNSGW